MCPGRGKLKVLGSIKDINITSVAIIFCDSG